MSKGDQISMVSLYLYKNKIKLGIDKMPAK